MVKVWCAAVMYTLAMHFAYVLFVAPVFEYAQYLYIPRSWWLIALTYVIAWLPLLAYRPVDLPANGGASLLYTLSYVPTQLMLQFLLERDTGYRLMVQLMLCLGMTLLFWAARRGGGQGGRMRVDQGVGLTRLNVPIAVLTLLAVILLVADNHGHMRLVSFEEVYDLRLEAGDKERSVLTSYLSTWLSYCFMSYYFARGIVERRLLLLLVGLTASVVIYAASGSKAAILMLPITAGVAWLWGDGRHFLMRLLWVLTTFVVGITVLLPTEGLGLWIKSLLLVRVIGTAGWTMVRYIEYFGDNGYTYFTHIGPINALTGGYPYGSYSLGQLIGIQYSGTEDANFNANFWASDGIAAMGPFGLLVASAMAAIVFYAINRFTQQVPARLMMLWLTGFWLAFLNVPLTTALLSGGGILTLLLVQLAGQRRASPQANLPPRLDAAQASPQRSKI